MFTIGELAQTDWLFVPPAEVSVMLPFGVIVMVPAAVVCVQVPLVVTV